MDRRKFVKNTCIGLSGAAASGLISSPIAKALVPFIRDNSKARKAIVIGMDGVDPGLVRRFVAEGKLPTFKKLMETGYFGPLQTTLPPQSPVAWSSFISGTNPGGHGIYDFIHRDASAFTPYLSTSRSFAGSSKIDIGHWSLPLESGRVELMRKGAKIWQPFEDAQIPATIFQIPGNFPVVGKSTRMISGMGTPDLLGGYGTFTYYTDTYVEGSEKFTSGRVVKVRLIDHKVKTVLQGPQNAFRNDGKPSEIDLIIRRDPSEQTVKIDIQDQQFLLRQGEWTDWVPLRFDFVPHVFSASGMVRFYAKEVHPRLKLYVSPINIDPADTSLPICSPANYSAEVSEAVGRFHTQGLPADTKGLAYGVLSNDEFLSQSKQVLLESERNFEFELSRFKEGLLFFYFSSVDQNSHMMWRNMDPTHPLYEPNASPEAKNAVTFFYQRMDEMLRLALSKVDSSTLLIALSDHGFCPFVREFHLSTWLVQQGYTAVTDPDKYQESEFFDYVDWNKTKAYALGINGIYLNLKGREKRGVVAADEIEALKAEIIAKLASVRDPQNGKRIIVTAYDSQKAYSGPFVSLAPDIVVGYDRGYRVSDEAVLGKFPRGIVGDRTDKWSADHCVDPSVVPGIFLTNWRCTGPNPGIWDVAPSILNAFGLPVPSGMTGTPQLEA